MKDYRGVDLLRDFCGIGGLVMLGIGGWMVAPYLGLMIPGGLLVLASIAGRRR